MVYGVFALEGRCPQCNTVIAGSCPHNYNKKGICLYCRKEATPYANGG